MFGKKDEFKYEVEVKALIREATEGLNQRIFALEMQNNQLIQRSQALEGEIYQLKNGLCNDFARLEKRITDFTDVWHPMMMANINRIKADLEKTIMEAEREDIKKVQEDLESKMVKIAEENINEHILIGYKSQNNGMCRVPVFIHKNCNWEELKQSLYSGLSHLPPLGASSLYLYKIKKLINVKSFDLQEINGLSIINNDETNIIVCGGNSRQNWEQWISSNEGVMGIKQVYKFCIDNGIKFVIKGQDRVNGVPIKMLFEDE